MLKFAAALAVLLVVPVVQAQDIAATPAVPEAPAAHTDSSAATPPTHGSAAGPSTDAGPANEAHGEAAQHAALPDARTDADCCVLPAGTELDLEIAQALSSKLNKNGDVFALRLVAPLSLDGRELVPAGAMGAGEVVHASPARPGGKAGELLLAGRYLSFGDQRLLLRGLKFGQSGKDNATAAAVTMVLIGPLGALIHGGQFEVPAGTRVRAKLAQEVRLPPISTPVAPTSAPAVETPPADPTSTVSDSTPQE
ncbi:MAG: hypothetical protein HOQ32_00470 [Lysobacter sp.]|nr:hypothetical protein [Lysobacter sp.]